MRKPRKILLAGVGHELRDMLDRAVREFPDLDIDEASTAEPQWLNGKVVACDALVVEVDLRSSASTETFERLAAATPTRKIIAAVRHADPQDVRRLFRAGAADVLTAPFSEAALEAALGEILAPRDSGDAHGRVITVLRGCGGVGATTVTLNLAALLGRGRGRGKGAPSGKKVAVLDLDLQFGDADLALNLEPRSTVVDVLRAQDRLDARLLQSAMIDHSSGLRLLAAPPRLIPLDALNPGFAGEIISTATQLYDYTFVDLPGGWSDWTLPILRRSSLIVLLAPPTVQGAVGARRVLEALEEADVTAPSLLALNKMSGVVEAFEKPSRIGKALNRGIDAVLSLDPTATRAFDRGVLLVDAFPNAKLSRELRNLAGKLETALAEPKHKSFQITGAAV
jgi:pilus assembly protein CpaE